MNLATALSVTVPIATDDEGVIRVGGTRVTLDTVIYAHNRGDTPEDIVDQYTSLKLADVYLVISYYLQNRAEVDEYLRRRREVQERVRQMNEARFDPVGIRERLLARRRSQSS
ncbi:MAG: DUF433 domain-containing protein [Acidobacteriota bacterium]|nr:DUF433 domain-containing protein [Acidobacteriota bacterium]